MDGPDYWVVGAVVVEVVVSLIWIVGITCLSW